jgi:hypothetical protein
MSMNIARTALVGVMLAGAACGGNSSSTIAPTTTTTTAPGGAVLTTELFTGVLPVKSSQTYSFTTANQGTVSVTLASLTMMQPGPALNIPLGLGLGMSSDGCTATSQVTATPALSPQITVALAAGTYCTSLSDIGQLTAPVNFAVRIVHP